VEVIPEYAWCVCKGLYFVVSSAAMLRDVTPVKGGSSCLMCVKS